MNMIQQYNDVLNAIDRKILRPIIFKDIQELHSLFRCLLNNGAKTLTQYSIHGVDKYEIAGPGHLIENWFRAPMSIGYDIIYSINNIDNRYHEYYTNKDKSILVRVIEITGDTYIRIIK